MTTTPQAALLSEAERCAKNLNKWNANDDCWSPEHIRARSESELRRLDALVAHLTADRDDTANELALRTKHNLALTNERDLLAKLQATQELVQAGSASLLDGCKSIMDSIAVSSSVIEHNKQEPVQAGELPDEREAFEATVLKDNPRAVLTKSRNGCYQDDELQAMWWAWQARAALSARKPLPYDLICNAIDLADTESMKGDYMLDSSDCIAVVRTMQALIEINGIGLEVKP